MRDPPLGSTEAHGYGELEFQVAWGILLVLYTDGIPETENADGSEFGEKALRAIAQEVGREGARRSGIASARWSRSTVGIGRNTTTSAWWWAK